MRVRVPSALPTKVDTIGRKCYGSTLGSNPSGVGSTPTRPAKNWTGSSEAEQRIFNPRVEMAEFSRSSNLDL